MLEVVAVYYLCKKNADNAKARGKKGAGTVIYTICFWIGFEVIGAIVGSFLGAILGLGDGIALVYIFALAFAAIGGLISNVISKAGPVVVQPPVVYYQPYQQTQQYQYMPNQEQQINPLDQTQVVNPYQCQRCGNINPSDSLFCMKCGNPLQISQSQEQQL